MECRLSDLRWREVINVSTGTRLGYVGDVVLDLKEGRVAALIVPGPARFFGLLGRGFTPISSAIQETQVQSLGRSPGEVIGYLLWYSYLENILD